MPILASREIMNCANHMLPFVIGRSSVNIPAHACKERRDDEVMSMLIC